jgi:hypothetical protein
MLVFWVAICAPLSGNADWTVTRTASASARERLRTGTGRGGDGGNEQLDECPHVATLTTSW